MSPSTQALAALLHRYPGLTFEQLRKDTLDNLNLKGLDRDAIQRAVQGASRLRHAVRDPMTAHLIAEAGYTTLGSIARRATASFVEDLREILDAKSLRDIQSRARGAHARYVAAWTRLREASSSYNRALKGPAAGVRTPLDRRRGVAPPAPRTTAAGESVDYAAIFGESAIRQTPDSMSVFGPGAYFYDLMDLIEEEITTPNLKTNGGTLPVAMSLRARRPDLWNLLITPNTIEGRVRQPDLIREVLESTLLQLAPTIPLLARDSANQPTNVHLCATYDELKAAVDVAVDDDLLVLTGSPEAMSGATLTVQKNVTIRAGATGVGFTCGSTSIFVLDAPRVSIEDIAFTVQGSAPAVQVVRCALSLSNTLFLRESNAPDCQGWAIQGNTRNSSEHVSAECTIRSSTFVDLSTSELSASPAAMFANLDASGSATFTLLSSILWHNGTIASGVSISHFKLDAGVANVAWCDVRGGDPRDEQIFYDSSNFSEDPLFVTDPTSNAVDYLQLQTESPCVGRGARGANVGAAAYDIYHTLSRAIYPFDAPFDAELTSARFALDALALPLPEVFEAMDPFVDPPDGMELSRAISVLGLGQADFEMLSTPASDAGTLCAYYGLTSFAEANVALIPSASASDRYTFRAADFIQWCGLTPQGLRDLVCQNLSPGELANGVQRGCGVWAETLGWRGFFPNVPSVASATTDTNPALTLVTTYAPVGRFVPILEAKTGNNAAEIKTSLNGKTSFSVAMWLFVLQGDSGILMLRPTSGGYPRMYWDIHPDGTLEIATYETSTSSRCEILRLNDRSLCGRWVHLVTTFTDGNNTASGTVRVYINGLERASGVDTGDQLKTLLTKTAIDLRVWADQTRSTTAPPKVALAELSTWGAALEPSFILSNFCAPPSTTSPNILNAWPLDSTYTSGSKKYFTASVGEKTALARYSTMTSVYLPEYRGELSESVTRCTEEGQAFVLLDLLSADDGSALVGMSLRHLDRANRFIRLARRLGWGFADLDWALFTLGVTELSTDSEFSHLSTLHQLQRESGARVEQLTQIAGWLRPFGRGSRGDSPPAFDAVYNRPPLSGMYFTPTMRHPLTLHDDDTSEDTADAPIAQRLANSLGMTVAELRQVRALAGATGDTLSIDWSSLSALYRLRALSVIFGLGIDATVQLLSFAGVTTLDDSFDAAAFLRLLRTHRDAALAGVQPPVLNFLVTNPETIHPSGDPTQTLVEQRFRNNLPQLQSACRVKMAPVRVTPESFVRLGVEAEPSAAFFNTCVTEGWITASGLVTGKLIERLPELVLSVPAQYGTLADALAAATDAIGAGTRSAMILVAPGEYSGVGNTRLSFNPGAAPGLLILRSEAGAERTTLRCDGEDYGAFLTLGCTLGTEVGVIVDGFTVRDNTNILGAGTISASDLTSLTVVRCRFISNTARNGGALFVNGPSPSARTSCSIRNTVFYENTATDGSTIYAINATITMDGVTIYHKSGATFPAGAVYLDNSSASASSSVLMGVNGSGITCDADCYTDLTVAGTADPVLVDPENGNFSLASTSPALAAATAGPPGYLSGATTSVDLLTGLALEQLDVLRKVLVPFFQSGNMPIAPILRYVEERWGQRALGLGGIELFSEGDPSEDATESVAYLRAVQLYLSVAYCAELGSAELSALLANPATFLLTPAAGSELWIPKSSELQLMLRYVMFKRRHPGTVSDLLAFMRAGDYSPPTDRLGGQLDEVSSSTFEVGKAGSTHTLSAAVALAVEYLTDDANRAALVLVHPGTYTSEEDTRVAASLDGKAGTLLIASVSGAAMTILDCAEVSAETSTDGNIQTTGGNVLRLEGGQNGAPRVVISGFTFRDNVHTDSQPGEMCSGAISLVGLANAAVEGCVFLKNTAEQGGAIFASAGSLGVYNCAFYGNSASGGGAVLAAQNAAVVALVRCTLYDNAPFDATDLFVLDSATITLAASIFDSSRLGADDDATGTCSASNDCYDTHCGDPWPTAPMDESFTLPQDSPAKGQCTDSLDPGYQGDRQTLLEGLYQPGYGEILRKQLERISTLTVIYVDATSDTPTLRAAINKALDFLTDVSHTALVLLAPDTYSSGEYTRIDPTLAGKKGSLVIASIAGASNTILDCKVVSTTTVDHVKGGLVFHFKCDVSSSCPKLTLSGLTIQNNTRQSTNNDHKYGCVLWLQNLSDVLVEDCVFLNNHGDNDTVIGVKFESSSNAYTVTLSDCVFYANDATARAAVATSEEHSKLAIKDSTIDKNTGTRDLYCKDHGKITLTNSIYDSSRKKTDGSGTITTTACYDSKNKDLNLTDPAGGDYSLAANSPAKGKGPHGGDPGYTGARATTVPDLLRSSLGQNPNVLVRDVGPKAADTTLSTAMADALEFLTDLSKTAVILLAPGTYTGADYTRVSATLSGKQGNLVLCSTGNARNTTLDCSSVAAQGSTTGAVTTTGGSALRFEVGTNSTAPKVYISGLCFRDNAHTSTDDNARTPGVIAVQGAAEVEVADCLFFNNSAEQGAAICATDATDATLIVRNCIFSGNAADDGAVLAVLGAANIQVKDCTLYHNSATGVDIALHETASAELVNAIVDSTRIVCDGGAGVTLTDCYDYGVEGDPLLADPAAGDFSLDAGSPAQGVGPKGTDPGYNETRSLKLRDEIRASVSTTTGGPDAQALADTFGWDVDVVRDLLETLGDNPGVLGAILDISRAVDLSLRSGVGVAVLRALAVRGTLFGAGGAQPLLAALHAKDRAAGARVSERIVEMKRRILLVFAMPAIDAQTRSSDFRVLDADDLSDYLLLDLSMGSETSTSRVVQATLSAQQYVQRIRLGLEPWITKFALSEERWAWMDSYRTWEANRRVYLYPENYLRPELRKDSTPLYASLLEAARSSEVNPARAEQLCGTFLEGLVELAGLRTVGAWYSLDPNTAPEAADGDTVERYHLIGRTTAQPYIYYSRCYEVLNDATTARVGARWTPWGRIDHAIASDYASPIVVEGELLLFWVEYTFAPETNEMIQGGTWTLRLRYSRRAVDGRWAAPMGPFPEVKLAPDVIPTDEEAWQRPFVAPTTWNSQAAVFVQVGDFGGGYAPLQFVLQQDECVASGFTPAAGDATFSALSAASQPATISVHTGLPAWSAAAVPLRDRALMAVRRMSTSRNLRLHALPLSASSDAYNEILIGDTQIQADDGSYLPLALTLHDGRAVLAPNTTGKIYGSPQGSGSDSWSELGTVCGTDTPTCVPQLARMGAWLYCAYTFASGSVHYIRVRRSRDGAKWTTVGTLANTAAAAPSLTVFGDTLHVLFVHNNYQSLMRATLRAGEWTVGEAYTGSNYYFAEVSPMVFWRGSVWCALGSTYERLLSGYSYIHRIWILNSASPTKAFTAKSIFDNAYNKTTALHTLPGLALLATPEALLLAYGKASSSSSLTTADATCVFSSGLDPMTDAWATSLSIQEGSSTATAAPISGMIYGYPIAATSATLFKPPGDTASAIPVGNRLGAWILGSTSGDMLAEAGTVTNDVWAPMAGSVTVTYDALTNSFTFGCSEATRPDLSAATWRYKRLGSTAAQALLDELNAGGVDALMAPTTQKTQEQSLTVIAAESISFALEDAFGLYYRELYYWLPWLLADRLTASLHHEQARGWLSYVFCPTDPTGTPAYWRSAWLNSVDVSSTEEALEAPDPSALALYHEDPFDVGAIANLRPSAYQKAMFMAYVDLLITWGDRLFSVNTRESLNDAAQLYRMTRDLLGPEPELLPYEAPPPRTYASLSESQDIPDGSEFLIELAEAPPQAGLEYNPSQTLPLQALYFGVPDNAAFANRWTQVSDRLYKIRHGLDLHGAPNPLPLFAPPIDPMAAVGAATTGGESSPSLSAGAMSLQSAPDDEAIRDLIYTAKDLAQALRELGQSLFSALQTRDAEALATLQANQESALAQQLSRLRVEEVNEARASLDALTHALAGARERQEHYKALHAKGLSPLEISAAAMSSTGIALHGFAATVRAAASPLHLLPNIFGLAAGGMDYGEAASSIAEASTELATVATETAALLSTQAEHARRAEEWVFEASLANHDIRQLSAEIRSAELRVKAAELQHAMEETTLRQRREVQRYYQTRFTNTELYDWMVNMLSGLCYQLYQLADNAARMAQSAVNQALGRNASFLSPGNWDAKRRGLLSGERLTVDIARMEQEYLRWQREQSQRSISVRLSLQQEDPEALAAIRTGGSSTFTVGEPFFARRQPSLLMRQHQTVRVSFVGLEDEEVHAVLEQRGGLLLRRPDRVASRFLLSREGSPTSAIGRSLSVVPTSFTATSGDSGALQGLRGYPTVGTYALRIYSGATRTDLSKLQDVQIEFVYSAQEGGSELQSVVESELPPLIERRLLRLHDRDLDPAQWTADDGVSLPIALTRERFSRNLPGRRFVIRRLALRIELAPPEAPGALSWSIDPWLPARQTAIPAGAGALTLDAPCSLPLERVCAASGVLRLGAASSVASAIRRVDLVVEAEELPHA